MASWQDTTLATKWRVLLYVQDYIETHGYAPTYSEIGAVFYLTRHTVRYHIMTLCDEGYLHHVPHRHRDLEVLRDYTPPQHPLESEDISIPARMLAYLSEYINAHGHSPTWMEIAAVLNISQMSVYRHLRHLRQWGHVKTDRWKHRSIRLVLPEEKAS